MTDTIKEFGQVLPDKRIATVAGYQVDVTRVPAIFTIEMMKLKQAAGTDEVSDLESLIDLIARICQVSVPEITKDMLLAKLDMPEITALSKFIMEPLNEKAKAIQAEESGSESGKNG